MTISVFTQLARAKINLALHVTGQREDGYHLLDTLVCFGDVGDRIKVSLAPQATQFVNLEIKGEFAPLLNDTQNNLITLAANALADELKKSGIDCPEVQIELEKNLPVASGLGGGSSDAATALDLLARLWQADNSLNLNAIAQSIGADVPMCLDHNPKRVGGIGEKLSPFNLNIPIAMLLVNPTIGVSTPEIFAELKNKRQSPITLEENTNINSLDQLVDIITPLRNDLQAPATSLVPQITQVLEQIQKQPGCLLTRMSGSGATCFGIFDNKTSADQAMIKIKETHSHWWSVACNTIAQGNSDHG